ncbi:hypothetical protein NPIL_520451 [Nephila pilipes]|uniref:Uncharacterized protein n=1 Tax=Nephila pilipes TaxID=299642 RepID=A0A8X6NC66_NEPPI|nr:hypothetical protein NPIL_520451 [Nephila pilipes]
MAARQAVLSSTPAFAATAAKRRAKSAPYNTRQNAASLSRRQHTANEKPQSQRKRAGQRLDAAAAAKLAYARPLRPAPAPCDISAAAKYTFPSLSLTACKQYGWPC